ncbi:class I SAM-dependent methyltransferase [Novosphingobium lentum]|uniref:class I SAM-dependent methyltransferase n=1 Tax=Novosphingobium lentum TaxID=145287 RepID=UPI000AEF337F|nr:class I SAM-dependent methyltransferase [Novosphingobium lentum]
MFTSKGYRLVACTACGLAFIANPPDAAELERLYSSATSYHTDLAAPGSALFLRMEGIAHDHLAVVRQVASSGDLLDVGCSTGQWLTLARSQGFDVAGVEFSAESAQFARDRFGLTVDRGSIHECTRPDASVDVLTMFDVIEHVPDPSADIAAAFRLLRGGGQFVLSTPNIDGLFPRLSYTLANRIGLWPHPDPPHHLYQFSVRTLGAMLEKAGFECGLVVHRNIDLPYTFGAPRALLRMPKRLAYALVFAPIAKLGPLIGQGDCFYIVARKPV